MGGVYYGGMMAVPPSGLPTDRSLELEFEPASAFRPSALQDDGPFADAQGKRIGILIVTYNAVSTIVKVLKRITQIGRAHV